MISLSIKGGVKLSILEPQVVLAVMVAKDVYEVLGAEEFVITSVNEGPHKKGSKHFTGQAFDCRIWTLPTDHVDIAATMIQQQLGHEFDVILEETHIHIEYDPK